MELRPVASSEAAAVISWAPPSLVDEGFGAQCATAGPRFRPCGISAALSSDRNTEGM